MYCQQGLSKINVSNTPIVLWERGNVRMGYFSTSMSVWIGW